MLKRIMTQEDLSNFFGSVFRFGAALVEHIATGAQRASNAAIDKRQSTCSTCEFKQGARCTACTCVLSIKVTWAEQKCPEGKWDAEAPSIPSKSSCCG